MFVIAVLYVVFVLLIGAEYWRSPKAKRPTDPVSSALLMPAVITSVIAMVMVMGAVAGALLLLVKLAEMAGIAPVDSPRGPK